MVSTPLINFLFCLFHFLVLELPFSKGYFFFNSFHFLHEILLFKKQTHYSHLILKFLNMVFIIAAFKSLPVHFNIRAVLGSLSVGCFLPWLCTAFSFLCLSSVVHATLGVVVIGNYCVLCQRFGRLGL